MGESSDSGNSDSSSEEYAMARDQREAERTERKVAGDTNEKLDQNGKRKKKSEKEKSREIMRGLQRTIKYRDFYVTNSGTNQRKILKRSNASSGMSVNYIRYRRNRKCNG